MRESEREFRQLFDEAPTGYHEIDIEGRITRINRAELEMLGYSAEEMLGRHVWEFVRNQEATRKAVGARIAGSVPLTPFEQTVVKKDGTRMLGLFQEWHLRDTDGRIIGIRTTVQDITERKRAEEALRESKDTLQALIDASPAAIIAVDHDGRVKTWNAAAEQIFGWSEKEVLGQPFLWAPEEHYPEHQYLRERVSRGEIFTGVEVRRQKKDGTLMNVSISGAPLHDAQGNVTGIMAIITDITDRKNLEYQFRQAQKMEAIGRLAGGIAHDFNNILTAIFAFGGLLLNRTGQDDPRRAGLEQIKKAAEQAALLTQQLLAFSRQQVLEPKVLDLNALVGEMEKMLRRIIGDDIELMTVLNPKLGHIEADRSQVEQVVVNLVVNARDAMPQGGNITIETDNAELDESYARQYAYVTPGPYVMLAVSDTGIGMDEETQSHIFEPFFTTKEPGKGTGLGLSTVYGIVKQSGGYIWVRSEPGDGTSFKVYFPLTKEAPQPADQPATSQRNFKGSEVILLVEDNEMVRDPTREILEESGYTVLPGENAQQALRICSTYKGRISLVITDVIMPGMSGRDLVKKLASLKPEMKVLYMSGYTEETISHHGVLDSGIAFLRKPFLPDTLLLKVREVLGSPGPA